MKLRLTCSSISQTFVTFHKISFLAFSCISHLNPYKFLRYKFPFINTVLSKTPRRYFCTITSLIFSSPMKKFRVLSDENVEWARKLLWDGSNSNSCTWKGSKPYGRRKMWESQKMFRVNTQIFLTFIDGITSTWK